MYPGPWPETITELEEAGHIYTPDLHDAEFLVFNGGAGQVPDPMPENIRWAQFVFSGIDRLLDAGDLKADGPRWANAAGTYGLPVAETALTLLLNQAHMVKTATMAGSFRVRGLIDKQGGRLHGSTVAIIGAGGIGKVLIEMLRGFGVRIIAVNHSGRIVPGADETFPMSEAGHVWGEADHVVLLAPLTEETRGLVDKHVLAKMKSSAILVNVGRGELVVTEDLVAALESGTIAGAGLDVTDPEPLPESHPLWRMPNCTITPHIACTGSTAIAMIGPQIIANAAAFEAGERMPTEIDPGRGY